MRSTSLRRKVFLFVQYKMCAYLMGWLTNIFLKLKLFIRKHIFVTHTNTIDENDFMFTDTKSLKTLKVFSTKHFPTFCFQEIEGGWRFNKQHIFPLDILFSFIRLYFLKVSIMNFEANSININHRVSMSFINLRQSFICHSKTIP